MASPSGNQHCDNCIGTLSFHVIHKPEVYNIYFRYIIRNAIRNAARGGPRWLSCRAKPSSLFTAHELNWSNVMSTCISTGLLTPEFADYAVRYESRKYHMFSIRK